MPRIARDSMRGVFSSSKFSPHLINHFTLHLLLTVPIICTPSLYPPEKGGISSSFQHSIKQNAEYARQAEALAKQPYRPRISPFFRQEARPMTTHCKNCSQLLKVTRPNSSEAARMSTWIKHTA
eukprot:1156257-Pelagomonas_calceolata.AAC.5